MKLLPRLLAFTIALILSIALATPGGVAVAEDVPAVASLELPAAAQPAVSLAPTEGVGVPVDAGVDTEDAATAPLDPADDPIGFLSRLYAAVESGEWLPALALAVIGLVFAIRKWKVLRWALPDAADDWLATDRGGAVLALSVALLGAAANAVLAGDGLPSLEALGSALKVAFLAAGGFTIVKKIFKPSDEIEIEVNGLPMIITDPLLTYERAAQLAGLSATSHPSVVVHRIKGGDRTLAPGQSVKIQDGAVIVAAITGSA